jgi:hypothetical protein
MSLATRINDLAAAVATAVKSTNREIGPVDHGALAWTIDPVATSSFTPTAGSVYAQRFRVAATGSASKVMMQCTTLSTTATAIYVGIYAKDGTQLAVSADVKAAFTTTGAKTLALVAPVALVAGQDYVFAFLSVTASPVITGSIGSAAPSLGVSTPLRQSKTTSTTRTALAAPEVWSGYAVVGNGPVALMVA